MASLAQSAAAVSRQFENLAPFARRRGRRSSTSATRLQQEQPALLSTIPLARRLNSLGDQAVPAAKDLDRLTSSLNQTGAIEFLMSLLYYGTTATNTFDSVGHFARNKPEVGSCASYVKTPTPGC